MFVLKNAWMSLERHPWRSITTVLIALVVAFATLFGWSVQAAETTAAGPGEQALKPAAAIRPTAATLAKRNGADASWTKHYLSWDDYTKYATAAQSTNLQFSYTFLESAPVRQSSSLTAIAGSADQPASKTGGELTMTGLYTADALQDNEAGQIRIVSGKAINYTGQAEANRHEALISQALATKNHLKVGDKVTVGRPGDATKTFTLTVRGIYAYTTPDASAPAKLAKDNRDNTIYTGYYAFNSNGLDANNAKGWAIPDLNIVFKLSSMGDYRQFTKAVKAAGLRATHEVSSSTVTRYRASIAPLADLAHCMRLGLLIAWIVGGLLLLALVILNLRNRGGEIGTGLVIGVSRGRLGWQFMLEVLMPTVAGAAIGILAGAFASGPLGSALASGHATAPDAGIIWHTIGWSALVAVVLAVIALVRVFLFQTTTLFTTREEAAR